MDSGHLQPLICIVDITIAQVFPSEAMTRRDKGNLLGEARWAIEVGREGSELGTKGSANTGRGTDGEGVARVGAWSQTGLGEDLVTEEGVFGVQNQPSEAGL